MDQANRFPIQVFRANDIRGNADNELTDEFTQALGQTFAKRVRQNGESTVLICCDARISSPRLHSALIRGLQSENIRVKDLGMGPTPLLGFALAHTDDVHSGIMITASHNPPEQNGFKMVLGGRSFFGEDLAALHAEMNNSEPTDPVVYPPETPAPEALCIEPKYIESIQSDIGSLAGFKVVIDGANGAAGILAKASFRALGADVVAQFCEPDGRFPHRSPDTGNPKNLRKLQQRVVQEQADIGIGFDGDGDRMVAVTESGRLLTPDQVISTFAQSVLETSPVNTKIVYDIKCSPELSETIRSHKGVPIMWRSGRSFLQSKMLEENAAFAGEYSAHYFFTDRWYGTDDGIYAAARLVQLCREKSQSLEQICPQVSDKVSPGERYLSVPESDKFDIVDQLMSITDFEIDGESPEIIDIDGLRLEYPKGWALVRASNTSAALTLRLEADTAEFMALLSEKITRILTDICSEIDPAQMQ